MAYEKPFLTTQDHAVGVQTINRALENNRALLEDQFDPGHSIGNGAFGSADPFLGPGRHDDPVISRTVLDVTITGGVLRVNMSGPLIVFGVVRVATGQWQLRLSNRRLVSAFATIRGTSAGHARTATCIYTPLSTTDDGDAGPFLTVTTWHVVSSALEDADFTVVMHTARVD